MEIKKSLFMGASLLAITSGTYAQTLMTIGNESVSKAEFLKTFTKNNSNTKITNKKQAVDDYLNLYSLFRMKVMEAKSLGLDTTAAVKSEINSYKDQLASNYLVDKTVTDNLAKEAYGRMQYQILSEHILIPVKPGQDSLKAKATIDSIYNVINSGKATFEAMAEQYSQDKGSAKNGGNVGYITALQFAYPYETAIYNTQVGQVSKPFTTQFGYHIVKVLDKKPNNGSLRVQQILINIPPDADPQMKAAGEAKLANVKADLRAGVPFDSLVAKYSDDKYSINNKGILPPITPGSMSPAFEAAANSLKKVGDISEPVQTSYGYHFIKLIGVEPLASYDSLKPNLYQAVKGDSRQSLAKAAYESKVKKEYNGKEYPENVTEVVNALPEIKGNDPNRYKQSLFGVGEYQKFTKPVLTLKGKTYTQSDFIDYAAAATRGYIPADRQGAFNSLFHSYVEQKLNEVQVANLEKNNPEFKSLLHEYSDGVLLFDMMDKNVWSKASNDNVALDKFYTDNKSKYYWAPGFEGLLYYSTNLKALEQVKNALDSGATNEEALQALNTPENGENIYQQKGRMDFSAYPMVNPNSLTLNKTSSYYKDEKGNTFFILPKVMNLTNEGKTFDEARGFVIADYQEYLEKNWNEELKKKYPVKVNQTVLKSIEK